MRRAFALFILLLLSACSYQQLFNQFSNPQEQALALQTATAVQKGDANWLVSHANAELRPQLNADLVHRMQALAPQGQPVLGSVNVQRMQGDARAIFLKQFVYEVAGGGKWALLQVVLETDGPKPVVNAVFVQPLNRSLLEANAFTFKDKGFIHYLWLAVMAAELAIILTAFVLALRTRRLHLKWLWCIGVLFAFGMFQLDWTTGSWTVTPISSLLLGDAVFQAGPFQPWVMTFGLPLIAIIFLVLRAMGRLPLKGDTVRPPKARKGAARFRSSAEEEPTDPA